MIIADVKGKCLTLVSKTVTILGVRQVICVGAATLDIFVRSDDFRVIPTSEGVVLCEAYGGKLEVNELTWVSGGGATNAAACFVRQWFDVGLIAEIGNDTPGKALVSELESLGIGTEMLVREDDEQTATSIVLVAPTGGRSIVTYRGASKMLEVKDIPWDSLDTDWLYITSLGGQMELLEALTSHAQQHGIKIAINPGAGELKHPEVIYRLAPYWEVLMLNESETASLTGASDHELPTLEPLAKTLGARQTIVTAGDKGAILILGDETWFCPPGTEKAIESTGAGDAFGSGFVSGLIRGWDSMKSLQLAQSNSVGVISQVGAKAGIISEEEFNSKEPAAIQRWESNN